MYGSERAEAQALDELEAVLRQVADELASWRARALRAEGDSKKNDPPPAAPSRRDKDLLAENDVLRRRVEAARGRVQELMARLTFLEEQAGNGSGGPR